MSKPRGSAIHADAMSRDMTRKQVAEAFVRFAAEREAPETELRFRNPYTLLVAVVLSAQATDVGVNKATGPLFDAADTPEAFCRSSTGRTWSRILEISPSTASSAIRSRVLL